MTSNHAKWTYHRKFRNSKKVLGCLVAANLQGACWISGHQFLGISGMSGHSSRKAPNKISRFHRFPRISVIPSINLQGISGILVIIPSVSLDFEHWKHRDKGIWPETHAKADQWKRSNSTTVNYNKITRLIPAVFWCNSCMCTSEINNPMIFVRVIVLDPIVIPKHFQHVANM